MGSLDNPPRRGAVGQIATMVLLRGPSERKTQTADQLAALDILFMSGPLSYAADLAVPYRLHLFHN